MSSGSDTSQSPPRWCTPQLRSRTCWTAGSAHVASSGTGMSGTRTVPGRSGMQESYRHDGSARTETSGCCEGCTVPIGRFSESLERHRGGVDIRLDDDRRGCRRPWAWRSSDCVVVTRAHLGSPALRYSRAHGSLPRFAPTSSTFLAITGSRTGSGCGLPAPGFSDYPSRADGGATASRCARWCPAGDCARVVFNGDPSDSADPSAR